MSFCPSSPTLFCYKPAHQNFTCRVRASSDVPDFLSANCGQEHSNGSGSCKQREYWISIHHYDRVEGVVNGFQLAGGNGSNKLVA
ncbi:hypothetical protein AgCh_025976 [Apium graveolens]